MLTQEYLQKYIEGLRAFFETLEVQQCIKFRDIVTEDKTEFIWTRI
jgi:hypothetical protein